jgi:energy-coupling factor transporter ATP-binding protein EcfA2
VMQDDHLFAGSIADNISFFSEHPDPQRIEQCAKLAAVHDDIRAMPMGYYTLIGDMGTVLSGGQKQRVLIARALYHQPSILLLDEATSHLDISREGAVNAAIGATQVTRIIVAHRPETIRSADRVLVLDQGQVVSGQEGPAASEEQRRRHAPSPVPKPTPRSPLQSPRQQARLLQTFTKAPTSTPQAPQPQRPNGGGWAARLWTRLASVLGRRLGAGLLARWGGVLGGRRGLSSAGYGMGLIATAMGLAGILMLMRGLPQSSPGELPPHRLRWPPVEVSYQAPAGEPFVFLLPSLVHTRAGRPVDVTLEASGDEPSWLQLDRERLSIGGTAPLAAEDRTYRLMIRAHAAQGGDGRWLVWLRIIGQPARRPVTRQFPGHWTW